MALHTYYPSHAQSPDDKSRRRSIYQASKALTYKNILSRIDCLSYSATNNKLVFVELDLSGLQLTSIELLEKYVHVQILKLNTNCLTDLSVLGKMHHLTYLDVSSNRNHVLLDFSPPINLRIVNYNRNLITAIPAMNNFWTVTKLQLDYNNIRRISVGISYCIQLTFLSLAGNEIKVIDNIQNLPLRVLILGKNDISDIRNIETLTCLEVFDLSQNKLKRLNGLQGHYYLHTLNLAENQISVSSELSILGKLPALRKLDLQQNPVCMGKLYKNKVLVAQPSLLSLDGRSLSVEEKVSAISAINPPRDEVAVRDRFVNSVYSFLQPLRVRESTSTSKFAQFSMLLLVGPLGSMKTSLVKRLVEEQPQIWCRGVPHTTRNPRKDEIPDQDYHFISLRTFENLLQSGHFIQNVNLYGDKYALSWDAVDFVAKKGLNFVAELELEAVLTLKLTHFRLHLLLVAPQTESIHLDRLENVLELHETAVRESMARRQMYFKYYHANPGAFYAYINTDDPDMAFKQLTTFAQELDHQLKNEFDYSQSSLVQWKPSLAVDRNNHLELASLEHRRNRAREAFIHNRPGKLYPPLASLKESCSVFDFDESPKSELSS